MSRRTVLDIFFCAKGTERSGKHRPRKILMKNLGRNVLPFSYEENNIEEKIVQNKNYHLGNC